MAAIWKGTISFGLVTIPVELHPAVREDRPRFRLLHAKDKSPVHYNRVCEREGKAVAWDDLVKGYEYSKGHYVVLTKDDFRTAAVEKTKTIDILDFVQAGEIDDRYFENSYYALAGTGGDRAYAVLREALRKSGRVGIGKIVLRDTQHLAELSVVDDALVLTMMRFQNELVDAGKFRFPAAKMVRDRELSMAEKLIDNLGHGLGSGPVQGRLPRQPDARDPRQGRGQGGPSQGRGHAAGRPRRRPDGTPQTEPRRPRPQARAPASAAPPEQPRITRTDAA